MRIERTGVAAATALLAMALTGCTQAAQLTCDEIAQRIQVQSQTQGVPVTRFTDVREESATDTERRCTAIAEVASGATGPVYLRGYTDANGQQMLAFQEVPFP